MPFIDRMLKGKLLICIQKPSMEHSPMLFQVYPGKDEPPHPHEVECGWALISPFLQPYFPLLLWFAFHFGLLMLILKGWSRAGLWRGVFDSFYYLFHLESFLIQFFAIDVITIWLGHCPQPPDPTPAHAYDLPIIVKNRNQWIPSYFYYLNNQKLSAFLS